MPSSLDAALSGMLAQQRNIELIANNIANVNTTGYKRLSVQFADILDTQQILAATAGDLSGITSTASGVAVAATPRVFAQGSLLQSPEPLDMAIVGEGFFRVLLEDARGVLEPAGTGSLASVSGTPVVQTAGVYAVTSTAAGAVTLTFTPNDGSAPTTTSGTVLPGEANTTLIPGLTLTFTNPLVGGADSVRITSTAYGRDGTFRVDTNRQLTTQLGRLLDPPLTFPAIFSQPRIDRDGTVVVRRPQTAAELAALGPDDSRDGVDEVVGRISLTRFDNAAGLISIGDSLYARSTDSPPTDGFPSEGGLGFVVGGFLEASNVDVADEMTSLMVASRTYQMNLAAYRTIEKMLAQAAQLV